MASRPQLAARRRAVGHSQQSLAALLEVRPQSVARWEQGVNTPVARHRLALAEVLDITPSELERLIIDSDRSNWLREPAPAPLADHYTALEQGADRLECFAPISVPALLQTERYALAVLRASHLELEDRVIFEQVQARLARQSVLFRKPTPLSLQCVIDESVLHRPAGGREVMVEQLAHLAASSDRPSIEVRVVRADSPALHCAAFGSFVLLTSAAAKRPFIACTEDPTGFTYIDRRDGIDAHAELFEHLTAVALSTAESIELIKTIEENFCE